MHRQPHIYSDICLFWAFLSGLQVCRLIFPASFYRIQKHKLCDKIDWWAFSSRRPIRSVKNFRRVAGTESGFIEGPLGDLLKQCLPENICLCKVLFASRSVFLLRSVLFPMSSWRSSVIVELNATNPFFPFLKY